MIIEISLFGLSMDEEMLLFGPLGADRKLSGVWSVGRSEPIGHWVGAPRYCYMTGNRMHAYVAEGLLQSLIRRGYARELRGGQAAKSG